MPTSIRLDPATEQRLEDLEDFYLAEATMARIRQGEEPVLSLDDVERELGLAD